MSDQFGIGFGTGIEEDSQEDVKEPSMYRVVLHNDHYTTMEFVVFILQKVFHKGIQDATNIMLDVHKKGRGTVGVFTYDEAYSKVQQVQALAKEAEYPLQCTVEEA